MKKILLRVLLVLAVVVVVLNWTWARLPAEPPLPPGSKFALVDGRKIHYVEKPGSGPAVVMIHGLPGTWGDWNAVAAELKGRRTIQIDRAGYAFSQEGYVPFAEQVQLVHRLTQKLGLKKPVIAGHSYGGAMALSYASLYPGDASGIVAVDPAVSPDDIQLKRKIQARFTKIMELPVLHQLGVLTCSNLIRKSGLMVGGTEAFSPDARDQGWLDRGLSLTARFRDLVAMADEMLAAQDALTTLQGQFKSIERPVQIVQGNDDKLVPASSVVAASKTIPGAQLTMLPGGHMQTYVHPGEVVAAIRRSTR